MAASYDNVDTWDGMKTAFGDDSGDTEITITLSSDIECMGVLKAQEGKTMIINGQTYTLTNVSLAGSGNVKIEANLNSTEDKNALTTSESVSVTVTGNIEADGNGIDANQNSTVTVEGNITAEDDGVDAEDNASVTVTGNITAKDNGIDTEKSATVTVNGDVNAHNGIEANDDTSVTVNGNITASDNGVYTEDNAKVTVKGNVTGANGCSAEEVANGTYAYSGGGNGINADDNSEVTVTGDVTGGDAYGSNGYGGDGVLADKNSMVTVNGNVSGGNVIADEGEVPDGSCRVNTAGSGIFMDSTAQVTVTGNVSGGNTNGQDGVAGDGAVIVLTLKEDSDSDETLENGSLSVGGTLSGGVSTNTISKGISGSGIYYFDTYYHFPMQIDSDVIADHCDDFSEVVLLFRGFLGYISPGLERFCLTAGYTYEETAQIYSAYMDELDKIYSTETGVSFKELMYDGRDNACEHANGLSDEKKASIKAQYLTLYNNTVSQIESHMDVLKQLFVPKIAVKSIQASDGTELIKSDATAAITELLCNEIGYHVQMETSQHGTVTVDKENAKPGDKVIVTPVAEKGYQITKVLLNGTEITAIDGVYSFIVPDDGKMELSAIFEPVVPQNPENTDNQTPQKPVIPENPENPDDETPQQPTTPVKPDNSENEPQEPVTPAEPDAADDKTQNSTTPVKPEAPGNTVNDNTGDKTTVTQIPQTSQTLQSPQTGDDAPLLALTATVVLSFSVIMGLIFKKIRKK